MDDEDDNKLVDECLEQIKRKHGVVTPELLLKITKAENHPLHGQFEWDNSVAGHKWRLEQAAQMIRASKYLVFLKEQSKDEKPIPVRSWIVAPGGESKYYPRKEALKKVNVRQDFINRKISTLRSWCNEAADVKELEGLRKSILKGLSSFTP